MNEEVHVFECMLPAGLVYIQGLHVLDVYTNRNGI